MGNILCLSGVSFKYGSGISARFLFENMSYVSEQKHVYSYSLDDNQLSEIFPKYFVVLDKLIYRILNKLLNYFGQDYSYMFSVFYSLSYLKYVYMRRFILRKGITELHLIFTQGLLAPKSYLRLVDNFGIKISLYSVDDAFLTGGCHYTMNCGFFSRGCIACPKVRSSRIQAKIRGNKEQWKRLFSSPDVKIVLPNSDTRFASTYMSVNVKSHILPIDTTEYNTIGLLKKSKWIVTAAVNHMEPRKGAHYVKAIPKDIILSAGWNLYSVGKSSVFEGWQDLGWLTHEELRNLLRESEVFISPSTVDSGPSLVNQALACGCKVVAFPIGVADMLRRYMTGVFVAKSNFDSLSFNEALLRAMDSKLCFREISNQYIRLQNYLHS